MSDAISDEELCDGLRELLDNGEIEICGERDGEPVYRLTEKGMKRAEAMLPPEFRRQ